MQRPERINIFYIIASENHYLWLIAIILIFEIIASTILNDNEQKGLFFKIIVREDHLSYSAFSPYLS